MGYGFLVWVLSFCVIKDWVLLDFTLVFDTWDLLTLKVWDTFCLEEEGVEWDEDLTKLMCDDDQGDVLFHIQFIEYLYGIFETQGDCLW